MNYIQEAISEWVFVVGQECPDEAWLCSPYDSWESNPYYRGPAVPHPESPYA